MMERIIYTLPQNHSQCDCGMNLERHHETNNTGTRHALYQNRSQCAPGKMKNERKTVGTDHVLPQTHSQCDCRPPFDAMDYRLEWVWYGIVTPWATNPLVTV